MPIGYSKIGKIFRLIMHGNDPQSNFMVPDAGKHQQKYLSAPMLYFVLAGIPNTLDNDHQGNITSNHCPDYDNFHPFVPSTPLSLSMQNAAIMKTIQYNVVPYRHFYLSQVHKSANGKLSSLCANTKHLETRKHLNKHFPVF